MFPVIYRMKLFSKNTVPGLPDGENSVILCSIVLTQYRHLTERRTDGRSVGLGIAAGADPGIKQRGRRMASEVARAYNGGLGAEPPAESRGRAPGQGVRGAKPPEAEHLIAF